MTDSTGTPAPAPGWYDDPAGTTRLRWWDGAQWTDDFHEPVQYGQPAAPGYVPAPGELPFAGVRSQPRLAADVPVVNVHIWLIVLLPILPLIAIATMDMRGYASLLLAGDPSGADESMLPVSMISWVVTIATIVLAYFDHRELRKAGLARPFHWAWTILASAIYVIGRSVVVRRHSGRGLSPLLAWVVVTVAYVVVFSVKADELMTLMTAIPVVPSGA